jgi:deoxycytidine triphosphate deaminase
MSLVALTIEPDARSVVTSSTDFTKDGPTVLIEYGDTKAFDQDSEECNDGYDLRVGSLYRDHRNEYAQVLKPNGTLVLLPGNAVIIQTEEFIEFPRHRFGQIFPKVTLLKKGIANTPSKVDPGFRGHLLISVFNYGRRKVTLRRGEPFCSLHIFTVEGPIRPYKMHEPPDIGAPRSASRLQRVGDLIDAYGGRVSVVAFVVSALAAVWALTR